MSPAPSTLDLSPAPSTSAANLKPRQGGESSRAPPALVCPVAKLGTKKETLTLYFFFLRKLFLFFSFTVSLLEFLLVPSIFISYLNSRQFCRFGRFGFGQFFRFKLNFHVLFQILKLQQHLYFYLLRFFPQYLSSSFHSDLHSSPRPKLLPLLAPFRHPQISPQLLRCWQNSPQLCCQEPCQEPLLQEGDQQPQLDTLLDLN